MPNLGLVVGFLSRVLRGERLRQATPGERRTEGASFALAGLIGLLLLSIDAEAWTAPPALLWTGVVLSLIPLAVFLCWIHESVPPICSVMLGLSVPVIAFAFCALRLPRLVPPLRVAQAGLALYVILMVLGPKTRKAD
jgi:hypothetical protein